MRMIIMRGPPGSGKSTVAQKFVQEDPNDTVVLSTDDYFTDQHGNYNFDSSSLPRAHVWNQGRAEMAAMLEIGTIVIDNTNVERWQYQAYVEIAKLHGYSVYQVPCHQNFGSVHGVPEHAIEKMREKFQKDSSLPTTLPFAGPSS